MSKETNTRPDTDGFRARLKRAMEMSGEKNAPLAAKAGLNPTFIRDIFKREGVPRIDTAVALAKALKVSPSWLLTGEGARIERSVPILSYVGAGAEVYSIDDHAKGAGHDEVDAPYGAGPSSVGLIVRGDSMWPAYKDGDILIYDEDLPPEHLVGKECVVELEDGRVLVKMIKRGEAGRFVLASHNAPDIENVQIARASRVNYVIKG